jgi:hypothetical protein
MLVSKNPVLNSFELTTQALGASVPHVTPVQINPIAKHHGNSQ